jgi:drug/metabolite transporter (DMT)-like permease
MVTGATLISPETLAISCGLGSALAWGAGDFSGGFATKKTSALIVIFYSQAIGLVLLIGLNAWFPGGTPTMAQFLWGGLAGGGGVLGLIALYKGLAVGRMGVVAPLSAVVTAVVPVALSAFTEGLPKHTQVIGFGLALAAVWFFSAAGEIYQIRKSEWVLSVLAGFGFSLFFICIDQVSRQAILWPLVAARLASVTIIGITLAIRRQLVLPPRDQMPYILLAGVFDISGNAFFALASKLGRLDVSAILACLYPASTVLLARFFLKERLHRQQFIGLIAACAALVLIAA